jgi:hypothetical protein
MLQQSTKASRNTLKNSITMYFTNQDPCDNPRIFGLEHLSYREWKLQNYGKYFYRIEYQNLKKIDYIPAKIIKSACKRKNFYILLDDTLEGYAYLNFDIVYSFVNTHNLPNKVIYVSGHLDANNEYKVWLKNKKRQKFFYVESNNNWYWRTRAYTVDNNVKLNINKTVWYSCLNNRPREHRLATVTYLDNLSLLEHGFVSANEKSYEIDPNNHNFVDYGFKDILFTPIQIYESNYVEILKYQADKVIKKLPLIVDISDLANKCLPHDFSSDIYNNALINLVTETFYFLSYNMISEMFITEKTWKAFAAKQIPIIIGPRGIVNKLRNFGFDMFDDVIDHSYDTEPDSTRLFSAINSLNRVINKYSVQELSDFTKTRRLQNFKIMTKGLPFDSPVWKVLTQ